MEREMEREMDELRRAALDSFKKFTQVQQDTVYAAFVEFDTDDSDTLSINEFQKFMSSGFQVFMGSGESLESIFRKMDADGDGKLEYNEFITLHYYLFIRPGVKLSYQLPNDLGDKKKRKRDEVWAKIQALATVCAIGNTAAQLGQCSMM